MDKRNISAFCVLAASALFAETVSLDGRGWFCDGEKVEVPHTWNLKDACDGGIPPKWGGHNAVSAPSYERKKASYWRDLPNPVKGKRYFVRFLGACEKTEVRVNKTPVGKHSGAFTAFTFEITSALKETGNTLYADVDNSYDPSIPPNEGDFSMFGGIYRGVQLIVKPEVCIDPLRNIKAEPDPDTGKVTLRVPVSGGEDFVKTFEFPNPELWSPENPKLYTVKVQVGEDEETVRFGFRKIEFKKDGFYLNGKKRRVNGVCRHQDIGGMGWVTPRHAIENDIRIVKELGADAIRTSHYPNAPEFYDLCDEYGILVWTEIPVVDEVPKDDPLFRKNTLDVAKEMVEQHWNHPSIILWGAFNEVYQFRKPDGSAEAVLSEVRELIHSLDPSRPVGGASNGAKIQLNAVPDVLGMNLYPGWYGKSADKMGEDIANALKVNNRTSVAISEYGAGASVFQHDDVLRRSSPGAEWHTEEYQAYFHSVAYLYIKNNPGVWGSFTWVMFDLASDSRHEGDRHGINDKGLVTRDRAVKKDAYWFYRSNWRTDEKILHLVGTRMKEVKSENVNVLAFSNAGDVTLFVNGKEVSTQKPNEVNAVLFKGVKLEKGANTVTVKSAGLEKSCSWVR